jgi:hypothetical protein
VNNVNVEGKTNMSSNLFVPALAAPLALAAIAPGPLTGIGLSRAATICTGRFRTVRARFSTRRQRVRSRAILIRACASISIAMRTVAAADRR